MLITVLYLANPFLLLLTYGFVLLRSTAVRSKLLIHFLILLATYLSFINLTKVPESDLLYHASIYLEAKNYSLENYLLFVKKEPVFYSFNYILYHISGGNFQLWLFTLSFVSYSILFAALIKCYKFFGCKMDFILWVLFATAFFPQLFSLSAHLVRQFLAGAILMYFLVDKTLYKGNKWWLAVLGVLIHSSTLLLFPLGYLNFLGKKLDLKNLKFYILTGIGLFGYQIVSKLLLPIFSDVSSIGYILERASTDTTFDLGEFPITYYLFLALIGINIIYMWRVKKLPEKLPGIRHFFSITLLLLFFIIINLKQSELSTRYFLYLCFFMPFIFPFLVFHRKFDMPRILFVLVLIPVFYVSISVGTWKYADVYDLIISSASYFIEYRNSVF